ncbi:hypothetical protein F2Q68_00038468 [Brassica cretica]|uniref:Uncharacterized protein n=2 Tax=Brassica cretica TaxID=69181 RepID=A0ABQ7ABU8_BRACR|nr:hypothetical protein F2Q68_00038468 [Brassica cretica]KAF3495096.1 hypothetical protein DY000_02052065 [Brassica cretica]
MSDHASLTASVSLSDHSVHANHNFPSDRADQTVQTVPSDHPDRTARTACCIDLRMSGMKLQLEPRPDDRTEARLSRTTRQAKADGQARINLERANYDSDRGLSLLARLARTACTGNCADDLTSLFDPIMDFSFGYFSKAKILKLSEDLGHAGMQLVRSERPAALAERPAHVLILPALDTASSDGPGHEPNRHLD